MHAGVLFESVAWGTAAREFKEERMYSVCDVHGGGPECMQRTIERSLEVLGAREERRRN